MPGARSEDILVRARSALLDVLEALWEQRDAIVVVGAQAVYLRTGSLDVALAETTKDSDVTIDPGQLRADPRLEEAMKEAGFLPTGNPGAWLRPDGVPIDLMVPEQLAGKGTRSAEIPPHDNRVARRALGLEAALVDNNEIVIASLDPQDSRTASAKVAGSAALLVAKLHKIGERIDTPHRLQDKDAHDLYRILRAIPTESLAQGGDETAFRQPQPRSHRDRHGVPERPLCGWPRRDRLDDGGPRRSRRWRTRDRRSRNSIPRPRLDRSTCDRRPGRSLTPSQRRTPRYEA